MKRTHRANLPFVAGAAIVAMVIAACGSSGTSTSGSSPSAGSSSAAALTASAPGITATTITIGSHQPLTGVAAPGYSEIAPASKAYFDYVNAHGGIFGRKIVYKYLNDVYNPTNTSNVVHQLVLQDNVYGIFNGLGTPTHLAVAQYLNSQKVPDVFIASGCECWNAPSTYPYSFGWQLDYVREGKILGNYVKQHFKGKKVGFFYQDDEFGQDGVKGLSYEIPKSQVVAKQSYNPANVNIGPQVAALKAAGAQVVVSFTVPAFTALLQLTSLKLQFKPQLGDTSNSWITLFKMVHDQYIPKLPFDGNVAYGLAVGYTFVQAMFKAGRNPTRQDLVNAIQAGMPQGPSVAPYAYSATDHNGITGAYMAVIKNGALVPKGPVLVTDTSPSGAITSFTGTQPAAPATGVPSP